MPKTKPTEKQEVRFNIGDYVMVTLLDGETQEVGQIEDMGAGTASVRTSQWKEKKWYKYSELTPSTAIRTTEEVAKIGLTQKENTQMTTPETPIESKNQDAVLTQVTSLVDEMIEESKQADNKKQKKSAKVKDAVKKVEDKPASNVFVKSGVWTMEELRKWMEPSDTTPEFKLLSTSETQDITYPTTLAELRSLKSIPVKDAEKALRVTDQQHVEHLFLAYDAGAQIPDIEVQPTTHGLVVVAGYHRWAAQEKLLAKKCKNEEDYNQKRKELTIFVKLHNFKSTTDMIDYAFADNLKNGLAMNDQSRSAYAIWLLQTAKAEGRKLTVVAAADKAQVSRIAVHRMMKRLSEKDAKMVDTIVSDETERVEIENDIADMEEIQKEKSKTSAVKALFQALTRVTEESDNINVLMETFKPYINRDNEKAISAVCHALENTMAHMK